MHQLEQLKCFDTIDARCKHEMKLHSSHFQGASFLIVVSTLKVFFQATSFLTVRKFTCRYALRFLKNTSHIQKPLKKKRTSSSGNNELLFVNSQIQITTACQMTTLELTKTTLLNVPFPQDFSAQNIRIFIIFIL